MRDYLRDGQLLGVPVADLLAATGAIVASALAIYLVRRLLLRRLQKVAERTRTTVDDAAVALVRRTPFFLALFVALRIVTQYFALVPSAERLVGAVATVSLFVQIGLWISAVIGFWATRVVEDRQHLAQSAGEATIRAIAFGLRLLLWSALLLVTLDTFDIDVTALIAGLGVGGIAVALAVQNILGDLLAALAIVLDKPFEVGDFIQVDDYLGSVQHVGIKTTRVRSLSGEELIFPNANLLQSRIRNYKRMAERRVVLAIGVTYQTDRALLARIPQLVREAIEAQEQVRFDRAHFSKLGDSALEYEAVYWVLTNDFNVHMDIKQTILLRLVAQFAELGIDFAYPTRTLFVHNEAAPTGGALTPSPAG
jgi:small-conductance mechanosensitive channel